MNLPLPELLRAVAEHGCTMRLEGETVRMRATAPLPDPILAELRARKAEVIDFLSQRSSRQVPVEWCDGVAQLSGLPPMADWPAAAWDRFQGALPGFVTIWAPQAAALGWSTLDVFGCHATAPYARLDQQGLALSLSEFELVVISERSAALSRDRLHNSPRMTYHHRAVEVLKGAVPIWSLRP